MAHVILVIHCASTWSMAGIIWVVQIIQYPLFAGISRHDFPDYYARYTKGIAAVVLGPMIAELITGFILIFLLFDSDRLLVCSGFVLIVLIWLSTFFIQVPQHKRLRKNFSVTDVTQLVRFNWIRTLLWTVRGILVMLMF